MPDAPITVSGGAGGIGAKLDDMRTEARVLQAITDRLLEQAQGAAILAADPDLLASAILSPVTAAAAEQKIVHASGQLLLFATEAGVTAVFLEGAVVAYETVDRTLAALANAAVNTGTFVVGTLAIPLVLGGALIAAADVALVYIAGYAGEAVAALGQGLRKTLATPGALAGPGVFGAVLAGNTAASFDTDTAQRSVQATLAAQLARLGELAGDHAEIVDLIAQGAPGLLTGLTLPATVLLSVALGPALGPASANALFSTLTGVPWPPTNYEEAVQAIIGTGNRGGFFDDGPLLTDANLFAPPAMVGATASPPTSVTDLFAGSTQIDTFDTLGGEADAFARIRITEIAGPPAHYIVQIPSTQVWDPTAGGTPNDVTADTHAMLDRQTALSSAVVAAMHRAGITATDPVMLEGFSLGGITAGQMAADTSLPFHITHVVTCGSPIANFEIPPSTQVLSFEYDEDPVAKLDGADNPPGANWTTVHATAPQLTSDNGAAPGIMGAHDSVRYAHTAAAVETAGNPSVTAWQRSATGFFAPGNTASTTTDYGATR